MKAIFLNMRASYFYPDRPLACLEYEDLSGAIVNIFQMSKMHSAKKLNTNNTE